MRKGIVSLVVTILVVPVVFAHAENILWNASGPNLVHRGGKVNAQSYLYNPHITIKYTVTVWELDPDDNKINQVASGARVDVGMKLLYEFAPLTYSDIYWFGTGKTYDSPYGDWSRSANPPPITERCAPKNLYAEGLTTSAPGNNVYWLNFASLAVAPPTRNVSVNGANCTVASDGVSKICTVTAAGTVNATFTFAPTIGHFYGGHYVDKDRSESMRYVHPGHFSLGGNRCGRFTEQAAPFEFLKLSDGAKYTLNIPQQTASHTVTAQEPDVDNRPPASPNLTAVGACTVGQAFSVSLTANDPDGDDIRYEVDWTNDGTIEETIPASGYLASGTSRTVSRTFAAAGGKTLRVRAQDEHSVRSSWASLTFTCAASDLPPTSTTTPFFEEDPFPNDGDPSDGPSINDLSLRALPSLVRTGNTTKVHWSSQNMASCEVTGTNGDSWSGLNSPVSGEASSAINGLVTYTLTCRAGGNTFTKTVNVNVLPDWVEK